MDMRTSEGNSWTCWCCWWDMADTCRVWDSWSLRVLRGLLQGSCKAPAAVLCTTANRFAQKDSCHFSFCWTLPDKRWAEKGHNILYHFGHVDVFPWGGEELWESWMLQAQREFSGSGEFNLISSAKPESLQGEWLEGFFLIITFFRGQGLRTVFISACSRVMRAGTSDTPAAGAPRSPALLTVLPLASTTPGCL